MFDVNILITLKIIPYTGTNIFAICDSKQTTLCFQTTPPPPNPPPPKKKNKTKKQKKQKKKTKKKTTFLYEINKLLFLRRVYLLSLVKLVYNEDFVRVQMSVQTRFWNLKGSEFSLRKHAYSNIVKILPPKNEMFQIKNSDIFHISAHNIDCGYSLEPPRRGSSNEYHNLCFEQK